MLKEQMSKIKEIFKNQEGNNKRKIENLVVFAIILIITIIIINAICNDNTNKKDKASEMQNNSNLKLANLQDTAEENETTDLEKKLEEILKNINGVGNVKVLLTYSESSKTIAMYNEDSTKNDTEETDTQGGNRKITQTSTKKEVIYQEVDGKKIPITQSVEKPQIEGAVVTAVGAKNVDVKASIVQAVEAATRTCNT